MTRAPDFAAPIVAWRAWLVVRQQGRMRLSSVVRPTLWEPRRELVGECLACAPRLLPWRRGRRAHESPGTRCGCGIYATSDPEVAGQYLDRSAIPRWGVAGRVIGLVSLWGRVLECERGWRGERAYPARIYVPVLSREVAAWRRVEEVAFSLADYGVPVELAAHRNARELVHSLV
jgi:hypothetical protein